MGDIAVDIGIPHEIEIIQGTLYDVEKGGIYSRADGSKFRVDAKTKNLSDPQLKLSKFSFSLAHLSHEEGNSSHKMI